MRHWLKALALLPLLVFAAPAQAAILPGTAVDGPSNSIDSTSRPDVDVAPDDSAALVYLKNDGGQNASVRLAARERRLGRTTASRFRFGVTRRPVSTSPSRTAARSSSRTSAVGRRRADKRRPGAPFGAEHIVQAGGSRSDVDLSPNGNGYVVAESSNDIFAERLDGDAWNDVGAGALDSDQSHEAGGGNRDVRIVASADGAGGAMAWGEILDGVGTEQDAFVRRLTGSTAGAALGTRLPAGSLPGSVAGSGKTADQPAIDMDGAGTIWVVYRQNFEYGATTRHRAIARPITGDTVGPASSWTRWGTPRPRAATSSRSP